MMENSLRFEPPTSNSPSPSEYIGSNLFATIAPYNKSRDPIWFVCVESEKTSL